MQSLVPTNDKKQSHRFLIETSHSLSIGSFRVCTLPARNLAAPTLPSSRLPSNDNFTIALHSFLDSIDFDLQFNNEMLAFPSFIPLVIETEFSNQLFKRILILSRADEKKYPQGHTAPRNV